jgi:hypothetical protein
LEEKGGFERVRAGKVIENKFGGKKYDENNGRPATNEEKGGGSRHKHGRKSEKTGNNKVGTNADVPKGRQRQTRGPNTGILMGKEQRERYLMGNGKGNNF